MRGGEPGLVRLQVADELPADGGGALGPLLHALLHAVLADGRQAVAGGVFDRGRRMGLGHRQQLHSGRVPAGRGGRPRRFASRTASARSLKVS